MLQTGWKTLVLYYFMHPLPTINAWPLTCIKLFYLNVTGMFEPSLLIFLSGLTFSQHDKYNSVSIILVMLLTS